MSTAQERLFYESFEDAAREVIEALGGTKAVGVRLWPAKTADAARSRLLDCLNSDRSDKFDPTEILTLAKWGREAGCHSIMNWLAQEAGYARPTPLAPLDEEAELMRQFIASVAEQRKIAERLERRGVRMVG